MYNENVNPLDAQSTWVHPKNIYEIQPPRMQQRWSGWPSSDHRKTSQGEKVQQHFCSKCHEPGHARNVYPSPAPTTVTSSFRVSDW